MAVVVSHSCKKSYGRLKYVFDGPPHNSSLVDRRVLCCSGWNINLLSDPNTGETSSKQSVAYMEKQFRDIRARANNPAKKQQAQSIVISFSRSEFDATNIEQQARQADLLVHKFAKCYFPESTQFVVATQADGESTEPLIHCHLLVNNILTNGKCVRTSLYTVNRLRKASDAFLQNNFSRVTGRTWPGLPGPQQQRSDADNLFTRSEWQKYLKKKVEIAAKRSNDLEQFKQTLKADGITITERQHGQAWTYHQQVKTNDGIKSYSIRDYYQRTDKKTGRVIATRGLGQSFTKETIISYLNNKKEEKFNEGIQKEQRKNKAINRKGEGRSDGVRSAQAVDQWKRQREAEQQHQHQVEITAAVKQQQEAEGERLQRQERRIDQQQSLRGVQGTSRSKIRGRKQRGPQSKDGKFGPEV